MKFFLDTEFIEDGKTIDLISIGIAAEDGRNYYAVNAECDVARANPWVSHNVIGKLDVSAEAIEREWKSRSEIAQEVAAFVAATAADRPKFWGYYADYDWVVLCQLFGTMMDLPEHWPMYCNDLKQFCMSIGNPKLPHQDSADEHNALKDAHWNKMVYEWLVAYQNQLATEYPSVVTPITSTKGAGA